METSSFRRVALSDLQIRKYFPTDLSYISLRHIGIRFGSFKNSLSNREYIPIIYFCFRCQMCLLNSACAVLFLIVTKYY